MKNQFHRKSIRLASYDYQKNGYYFVTICTQDRYPLFGTIHDRKMILNPSGIIADQCMREIPDHFSDTIVDAHVIMPDHIHAIIRICGRGMACHAPTTRHNPNQTDDPNQIIKSNHHQTDTQRHIGGMACHAPTIKESTSKISTMNRSSAIQLRFFGKPISRSLPTIVASYKSATSKIIHKETRFIQPIWQRNYFERIIRNQDHLNATREYIRKNPEKWKKD